MFTNEIEDGCKAPLKPSIKFIKRLLLICFRVWWRKGAKIDSPTGSTWKHISGNLAKVYTSYINYKQISRLISGTG